MTYGTDWRRTGLPHPNTKNCFLIIEPFAIISGGGGRQTHYPSSYAMEENGASVSGGLRDWVGYGSLFACTTHRAIPD